MDPKKAISKILDSVSKNAPAEGEVFLASNVVLYMDTLKTVGVEAWEKWVKYLHKDNPKSIRFIIDDIVERSNIYHVVGKVRCERFDGEKTENDLVAAYEFKNGKIIEIKSRRKNYTSILGGYFDSFLGFWWHMFKFSLFSGK